MLRYVRAMRWLVAMMIVLAACGPTAEHGDPPTAIMIAPAMPLLAVGMTAHLTATATYADGSTDDVTTRVAWSSSASSVATVDASGLLSAAGAGTATITAALDSVTGSMPVDITAAALTAITVAPAVPTLPLGTHQQLAAMATFADGSTADVTAMATWASNRPQIATVSAGGLVSGDAIGAATIIATLDTVTGTAMVGVTGAVLVSIDITAASPSLPQSYTEQLFATGTFTDGTTQDLSADVTWSSSNMTFATVSASGLATAVGPGMATIDAVNGAITGTKQLTVDNATLQAIAIAPEMPAVARGTTRQFAATGSFSDGSTLDVTSQVTWASSNRRWRPYPAPVWHRRSP